MVAAETAVADADLKGEAIALARIRVLPADARTQVDQVNPHPPPIARRPLGRMPTGDLPDPEITSAMESLTAASPEPIDRTDRLKDQARVRLPCKEIVRHAPRRRDLACVRSERSLALNLELRQALVAKGKASTVSAGNRSSPNVAAAKLVLRVLVQPLAVVRDLLVRSPRPRQRTKEFVARSAVAPPAAPERRTEMIMSRELRPGSWLPRRSLSSTGECATR